MCNLLDAWIKGDKISMAGTTPTEPTTEKTASFFDTMPNVNLEDFINQQETTKQAGAVASAVQSVSYALPDDTKAKLDALAYFDAIEDLRKTASASNSEEQEDADALFEEVYLQEMDALEKSAASGDVGRVRKAAEAVKHTLDAPARFVRRRALKSGWASASAGKGVPSRAQFAYDHAEAIGRTAAGAAVAGAGAGGYAGYRAYKNRNNEKAASYQPSDDADALFEEVYLQEMDALEKSANLELQSELFYGSIYRNNFNNAYNENIQALKQGLS